MVADFNDLLLCLENPAYYAWLRTLKEGDHVLMIGHKFKIPHTQPGRVTKVNLNSINVMGDSGWGEFRVYTKRRRSGVASLVLKGMGARMTETQKQFAERMRMNRARAEREERMEIRSMLCRKAATGDTAAASLLSKLPGSKEEQ